MLVVLLKYLFYFAILGCIMYIAKLLLTKNNPPQPPPPPKKIRGGEYWEDIEDEIKEPLKKYDDRDFV